MIALDRVEDERLVRFGNLWVRKSPLVCQIHLGRYRAHLQTWLLGVQLQIHGLGGLNAQDELVARDVLEDARGGLLELNPHFHLAVIQGFKPQTRQLVRSLRSRDNFFTFPGFKDEGHALPTRIVDPQRRRSESWARGIRRDSVVIKVARFPVGTHVLAQECVLSRDRRNCTENLDLNVDIRNECDT